MSGIDTFYIYCQTFVLLEWSKQIGENIVSSQSSERAIRETGFIQMENCSSETMRTKIPRKYILLGCKQGIVCIILWLLIFTYNAESAWDRYWFLRVELTDIFAGIRFLHPLNVEEPGVPIIKGWWESFILRQHVWEHRNDALLRMKPGNLQNTFFDQFNFNINEQV